MTAGVPLGPRKRARTAPPPAPPSLERYELLEVIARGGMGTVYKARDRTTGQLSALKCVVPSAHKHPEVLLEGVRREYQVLKGLRHPRIIGVYDYGRISGGAYYTMELLEGDDLRKGGPLPWREVCQYLHDVATCLSLLHARRLLHGDLSPGNVKRTGRGHVKLIDFGALTSFGRTDTIVGTPPFIAPEVLTVGRLDQRVDLYALGALGYYLLTGTHAYPAPTIDALPLALATAPAEIRDLKADVPPALVGLVMDLLRQDPLARPANAAAVIAKLESIADLDTEYEGERGLLAQSFLAAPSFVGRRGELVHIERALGAAAEGCGSAIRLLAPSGMGRTRMLEEAAVRAALSGATVLRADAGVQRGRLGVARALVSALLQDMPQAARRHALEYLVELDALGDPAISHAIRETTQSTAARLREGRQARRAALRVASSTRRDVPVPLPPLRQGAGVEQWFLEMSRERPLVILVDNVEAADDASVGVLAALARATAHQRVLFLCAEQTSAGERVPYGMTTLRGACVELHLKELSQDDTKALMRSMFGEAQRVERLADWLHTKSAGSPLHCLGLVRELVSRGEIRHEHGAWVLPSSRPDTRVAEALEDALALRLEALSPTTRSLVECLAVHRLDPTFDLCCALLGEDNPWHVEVRLDELAANDVLHRDHSHVRFSSAALRQVARKRMDPGARRASHRRLGEALAALSAPEDSLMHLEAGFQLIRGGAELRGADMIASVTRDSMTTNMLVADLNQVGPTLEAALKVYRRARASRRKRLSLLTALAQAGYYEHYKWAELYGDEALDLAEDLSGLRLARRLRPAMGSHLALLIGLASGFVRHYLAPKGEGGGRFINLMVHVCSAVTAITGVAAIQLDAERCDRVAAMLAPIAHLPKRMALVGVYRFCRAVQQIARENQAEAFATFDQLAKEFSRPGYYKLLPENGRLSYVAACHFGRGAFAMMRADAGAALESADVLERSGWPLYQMIASQIRKLCHLNRGDMGMALMQQERVELHAARVGSAWQVECWEPAAMIPYHLVTQDVVELSRIHHRVTTLVEHVPSMWRYRELARLTLSVGAWTEEDIAGLRRACDGAAPRSFIGWSVVQACIAMAHNFRGEHEQALSACQTALDYMTADDRDYVFIFLQVDIQAALAEAGLGRTGDANARLDAMLERHADSENALVLGLLHEARARVALAAGQREVFYVHLEAAGRWLRGTATPALVAIADRLAAEGLPTRSAVISDEVESEETHDTVVERRAFGQD